MTSWPTSSRSQRRWDYLEGHDPNVLLTANTSAQICRSIRTPHDPNVVNSKETRESRTVHQRVLLSRPDIPWRWPRNICLTSVVSSTGQPTTIIAPKHIGIGGIVSAISAHNLSMRLLRLFANQQIILLVVLWLSAYSLPSIIRSSSRTVSLPISCSIGHRSR